MSNATSDNSCGGLKQSLYFTTILDKKFHRAAKLHYTLVKTLLLYIHGEVVLVCIIDYLCMSASHCMSVCLSSVSHRRRGGMVRRMPVPYPSTLVREEVKIAQGDQPTCPHQRPRNC